MSHEESTGAPSQEPLRPVVTRIEEPPPSPFEVFEQPAAAPPPGPMKPRFPLLPLILFVLTIITTWSSGTEMFTLKKADGTIAHYGIWEGLQYSALVLAILGAHEMGHYVQAKRHQVPASLPMFIPMPFGPIGTMGAVIFQRPGVADRRAMFDIAISGPLAGLVVAVPVLWWGLMQTEPSTLPDFIPDGRMIPIFSDPLLTRAMSRLIHGPILPDQELGMNPFVFAGWVGIFITALNMFPLGQLDGGHILYTLLGKPAHAVARNLFRLLVILMVVAGYFDSSYFVWTLMLLLVWRMGVEHPPTTDDAQPLGRFRTILGWVTLTFVFWGFVPRPMYELRNEELQARRAAAAAIRAQAAPTK